MTQVPPLMALSEANKDLADKQKEAEKQVADLQEAVKKCDCPEAQAFTKQQETIASAEGMIREFFKDKESLEAIKTLLLSAVEPLAKHEIGSISISKNGYTGAMKPSKDGIKVSLKYTTVDSVES